MSNSYETGYRWYLCYQTNNRIDVKKYECIRSTFQEAINPIETGRPVFIPAFVPPILDTVIIKSKLSDSVKVKIQE